MKKNLSQYLGALALGAVLTTTALGQAVVQESTTTNSIGTISEFSPDTIVIRSETSPDPVRYSYTKTTSYVDETGAPVTIATVKSGLPVTVHYSRVGDRLVANRVVVRRSTTVAPAAPAIPAAPAAPAIIEKKTTTTTTTEK